METLARRAAALLAALALLVLPGPLSAGAYEAKLPDDLATAPDLCARVACNEVMPGATAFSERKGQPPYVEAYAGDGPARTLVGYVVLSTDVTDTPAYSGKPVVTLIGLDTAGRYVGVKVLKHSEPILLLGIPESALTGFNDQYLSKSVRDKIEVGPARPDEGVLGVDAFTFRDLDYLNLYGLEAAGAPAFNESAIFIIRSKAFSAAYPWKLSFLGNRVDRATGTRTFANFDSAYWMPAAALEGGRPAVDMPQAPWVRVWKTRAVEIALFAVLLVSVTVVYALRERLTRRATHRNKWAVNGFKYTAWSLSLVFVGFGAMAQPSVTQVLTWFHALLFKWQWALFLSDPFIFLFWIFIIATVFLFGRGLFCGWMCPFGSLQEILYKVAARVGLKRWQFKLPQRWHDRLKWVKYVVFFGLLTVSMFSMGLAEVLAEVEPFKTTFLVGIGNRTWPYTLFVAVLLGLSLFIERPYCKYLCPLGGALAMPSTFRWFGLRRKPDCNRCKACAVGCGAQAIDAHGRIDHRECLHCLDCMVLYTDATGCPPLVKERKQRERAGLPLTPIGRHGYFIPIVPMPADEDPATRPVKGVDPRLPTPSVTPPYAAGSGLFTWLLGELRDHLWPWSRAGWRGARALQAAGIALAIAATVAWLLAADGRMSSAAVIGWWFGWSVYEVLIRMQGKRHVKDGPWWGRTWREAGLMDMLSYVGFKNLLIGATLFIGLQTFGLLAA